ncbi:MAG TPA: indole-3-glycerol phosphate synthase TrpC, partial [Bacteroidia bacterium]|nr:indole-3-glycerol phosphate synthase TrpC [Bacteroidia bacterium]
MRTLFDIVDFKKQEVEQRKQLYPVRLLETSIYFESDSVSLKKYLLRKDKSGIIAEFKKQSPSLGIINKYAEIEKISIGYMQSGASALSVLTDSKYFGGSNNDLSLARKFNYCPVLRKDFIIDEYQILEAKSIGADAVLLIASILTYQEIKNFTHLAHQLKMEVLLELHGEEEINKVDGDADVIGINNRDLKTMSIDLTHSVRMKKSLPSNAVLVS